MGFFNWIKRRKKQLKIGLALGSGGAKGFAHLGVLKAFEDNDIKIDMIAGTSIGSIIGAFYSNDYSVTDISELLKTISFGEIKNINMITDMQGLNDVIDRSIGHLDIEELKKPFRAIATEVETGKEKVFDSGNVADALCASCSIPPFFKAFLIDGKRYVDGAFVNSVPADVVRTLGADYVIGVDLRTEKSEKPSLLSRIFPTYKSDVKEPWKKGYDFSDVVIHPDLNEYSSTSFFSGSKMYDIGYQTALEFIPKIKGDIDKLQNRKRL